MKTTDDLGRSMHAHLDEITDTGVFDRVAAVHGRVRRTRRRRAAAVASGAAMAVLAAVGVSIAGLPGQGDERPALLGIPVPDRIDSRGFGYSYLDGEADADATEITIELKRSERPRLVTWATAGDDQDVVVSSPGQRFASGRPDFTDYVLADSGTPEVTITADRPGLAIAVYELTEAAPGVTTDGVTWRQDVLGGELVDAVIGAAGETSASMTVTLPEGGLELREYCVGAPDAGTDEQGNVRPPRYDVEWSVDGTPLTSSSCEEGGRAAYDPGATGGTTFGKRKGIPDGDGWYTAGDEVTLGLTVTTSDGDPVDDPNVRIGGALYRSSGDTATVAGVEIPAVVEADGHRFELVDRAEARLGAHEQWEVPVPATDERVILTLVFDLGNENMSFDVLRNGEVVLGVSSFGKSTSYDHQPLAPGVRTVGLEPNGAAHVGLAFYELAD